MALASAAISANIDAANKSANKTGTVANPSNSGLSNSLQSLASNFTNFISLLTTQLKNQDPTSPMETNEFTQELIGFSQVQQSVEQNTNLNKLIAATQAANINNSVSYVNQLIDANTNAVNLKTGKPIPEMGYELPSNTSSTKIYITSSDGTVIRTMDGSTVTGKHSITWDGKDSKGNTVTDGTYKFQVAALDKDQKDVVGITNHVTDYVSSVDFQNGTSTLYFGDVAITTDKILSIKGYYSQDLTQQATGTAPGA